MTRCRKLAWPAPRLGKNAANPSSMAQEAVASHTVGAVAVFHAHYTLAWGSWRLEMQVVIGKLGPGSLYKRSGFGKPYPAHPDVR